MDNDFDASLFHIRGLIYSKLERYYDALIDFSQVIQIKPTK